mgnify:CR=1 FL=1
MSIAQGESGRIRNKEQEHKLDEYRKFIDMFIPKNSLAGLEKLNEKLDGYEVNIDLFDDIKYESAG